MKPVALASELVGGLLQQAFDQERFNWLVELDGADADGPVTITTGYGKRNTDGTFSFSMNDAPGPGPTDRWDPITITGALTGEAVMGSYDAVVILPILNMETVVLELPLYEVEIEQATMSEMRSCVGTRGPRNFDTSAASLHTYIRVEDAAAARLMVGTTINTYLCNFIAGISDTSMTCTSFPRAMWGALPDATCSATGCMTGGCEPASDDPAMQCNAWEVSGGFSAAGVEITETTP